MDGFNVSERYIVKETLDCKGLYCPMPIVKILATDPGSKRDFEAFCRKTGNKLLESSEEDGVFTYVVEKVGA